MRNKSVTMNDIATMLGISKNAVSLALRGKDGVSEELRRQVMEKAKELHYGIEEKVHGHILALIPQRFSDSPVSNFYQQLCFRMETYSRSQGYLLVMCSVSEEDEHNLAPHPMINSLPFRGIITIGNLSKEYCQMIKDTGMRYVMADQYYDDVPVDCVLSSNQSGAYQLTQHLIDQGHQRIQFIGMPRRTSSLKDRFTGYRQALDLAGLPVLHNSLHDEVDYEQFTEFNVIKKAVSSMSELPTAFVCGHDMTAKYLIDILADHDLHYPDDFSVVGFDDIQDPDLLSLQLTTYRTPKDEIAIAAIDLLLYDNRRSARKVELYGQVIHRKSVKKL